MRWPGLDWLQSRASDGEPTPGDWLHGCGGFVVQSDAARIGRVTEVQRDAGSGRAVALVLRAGIAGRRRLVVPVEDVAAVLPSSNRIILNGSWAPTAEERAAPSPVH